ncbi:Butyrophilin subfamily 1 member A1, partial [Larimichthys crocea]
ESLVDGPPEKVLAFAGGDVILPCSFNITDNNDFPTVEWSKEGLRPSVVFLYRDGCEIHEMKNPAFEYRTSFINKELQNGNISLRISNVQLSDAGKYKCMRLWKNAPRDITTVELVVVDCMRPCFLPIVIAVGVTIFLAVIACGIAVFVRKTYAVGQKLPLMRVSSDQSTKSSVSLNQPLLNPRPEDNKGKSKIEEMKKQPQPTASFQNLAAYPRIRLQSKASHDKTVVQHLACVIQKSHRNHSCPALNVYAAVAPSSSLANTAKKNPQNLTRSLSMTSARPGPKVSKPQRRSSLVLTPSALLSSNRFGPLAEVDED